MAVEADTEPESAIAELVAMLERLHARSRAGTVEEREGEYDDWRATNALLARYKPAASAISREARDGRPTETVTPDGSQELGERYDPIHHVELTFDGDASPTSLKLICPPTGCKPPGFCTECGRSRGDEREPCDMCYPDDEERCNVKDWTDAGEWYLSGTVTLPVEIDWDSDEGPTLNLVEPQTEAERES